MDTTAQSTIRRLAVVSTLCWSCAGIAACSGKGKKDWFRWGRDEVVEPAGNGVNDSDPESMDLDSESETLEVLDPQSDPIAEPSPEITQETPDPTPPLIQPNTGVDEIVQLYRRLHVEMEPSGRSQLIVELLKDSRERVRLLGFELASRDLSSGATLSADAANAAMQLMSDPLPSIRQGAARLITRLALPDAMTQITNALKSEQDPAVAETLLRGIERWPNADASDEVLRWYQSEGTVRVAAANAAWGITDLGLWNADTDESILRSVYRSLDDSELTRADMRLIAVTGSETDIERLIGLTRDPEFAQRADAASALVQTARGVDTLIRLAQDEPKFAPAAAEAIQRHRLNPEGIRRLASLAWLDETARVETLGKACARLNHEQLSDAITLARADGSISDALAITLLNPLLTGPQNISAKSAPGVILLAELELNNQRPDRALEILSLLSDREIEPDELARSNATKKVAHILLLEFEEAIRLGADVDTWFHAIALQSKPSQKLAIASEIQRRGLKVSESQQTELDSILSSASPAPVDDGSEQESELTSESTEQPQP